MRILLDTNIISYLVKDPQGRVAARIAAIEPDAIFTSVIVVGEIEYGFAKRPAPKLERQTASIFKGIEVVGIDRDTAEFYGRIRSQLEKAGTPIGENDLWIAAHALALGATLVTANEREFRRVSRLRVENWAA